MSLTRNMHEIFVVRTKITPSTLLRSYSELITKKHGRTKVGEHKVRMDTLGFNFKRYFIFNDTLCLTLLLSKSILGIYG